MKIRLDILRQIATATVLAVLLSAFPACSGSVDDGDRDLVPPSAEQYSLSLFLTAGDNTPAVRATPDGSYNPGAGFENYIDIAGFDFRVYIFGADNKLIYAVPTVGCLLTPMETTGQGSKRYHLSIPMERSLIDRLKLDPVRCSLKLVLLANWREYSSAVLEGETTIASLVNMAYGRRSFAAQAGPFLTADERIPLFGVNYYPNVELVKNGQTFLPTLHLLRSYAKIEVFDSEESTTKIHSVALTRHSRSGFNAPMLARWLEDEYVKNNYKDDYGRTFRDPGDEETSALPLHRDPESGHFFVYVPEFRNLAESSTSEPRGENERSRLKVTYLDDASGERHQYCVEFKYYDEVNASRNGAKKGDFFNITRNYWYRYSVNRGKVDAVMQVDIVPYAEVVLKPSFGFDEPIVGTPETGRVPSWVEITPWDDEE